MNDSFQSRRRFLKTAAISTGAILLPRVDGFSQVQVSNPVSETSESRPADYTLRIRVSPIEIAPNRIISTTNYNGQFPGPLIRLKEGQPVTVDIFNDTDVPEQLHWHGQMVPVDVDGAAEEGTPFVPAHGKRRSHSRRTRQDSVSITRTIERARISLLVNTAERLVLCISRPKMSRATTIARSFSC
jgi:hypothetical protein